MYRVVKYIRSWFQRSWTVAKLIERAENTNIDPYSHDAVITIRTPDISAAIHLLTYANSVDPYEEYMVRLDYPVPLARTTSISDWYSINNRLIEPDVIKDWLGPAKTLVATYNIGSKYEPSTLIYKNSVRIKPLVDEIEILLRELLNVG